MLATTAEAATSTTPIPESVASSVRAVLASISSAPWFQHGGAEDNRSECEVRLSEYLARCHRAALGAAWVQSWAEAGAMARALDDGAVLWAAEDEARHRALKALSSAGRSEALECALNELSETGYESVRANHPDEELARAASGAALWTASGAITWAMAEDRLSHEENLFLPKLRIFQLGHWPLGIRRGAFAVF